MPSLVLILMFLRAPGELAQEGGLLLLIFCAHLGGGPGRLRAPGGGLGRWPGRSREASFGRPLNGWKAASRG